MRCQGFAVGVAFLYLYYDVGSPKQVLFFATALSTASRGQRKHRRLKNEGRSRRIDVLRDRQKEASLSSPEALELEALRNKGDPFDASLFDADHAAFKASHNRAFAQLATYSSSARNNHGFHPVIYLDGKDGATTQALLEAGFDRDGELFVVNEWKDTVEELRAKYLLSESHCIHGRMEHLLPQLSHIPFCAAYLDGCNGDPKAIIAMIQSLLLHAPPDGETTPVTVDRLVIGFTLTNAEPSGRDLLDRIQDVTRATLALARRSGYRSMCHVGDDPTRFGVDPMLIRKHDETSTSWLVLTT